MIIATSATSQMWRSKKKKEKRKKKDTLPKLIMAAGLYGELSGIFKILATIHLFIYFLVISGGYLTGALQVLGRK